MAYWRVRGLRKLRESDSISSDLMGTRAGRHPWVPTGILEADREWSFSGGRVAGHGTEKIAEIFISL